MEEWFLQGMGIVRMSETEGDTMRLAYNRIKNIGPQEVVARLNRPSPVAGIQVDPGLARNVVENCTVTSESNPWHEETCAVMGLWATPKARVHVKLASGTEVVVPLDVGEQFELLENVTVSIRGEKKRPEQ